MRTCVYVDGFNLYYGAVKGTSFKWLDLLRLSREVLPSRCNIRKLKYFTARVSGASDPDEPKRQQIYLNALNTIPEIEVYFGSFLSKTTWRPLMNLPVANRQIHSPRPVTLPRGNHSVSGNPCQTLPVGSYGGNSGRNARQNRPLPDAIVSEIHTMEEKGSDVNLATHLLNDAWKNDYDAAAVISNDTDLITPIDIVVRERQKNIYIVCPGRWQVAPKLKRAATHVRHIRRSMLRNSQFPDSIPGTQISKPDGW